MSSPTHSDSTSVFIEADSAPTLDARALCLKIAERAAAAADRAAARAATLARRARVVRVFNVVMCSVVSASAGAAAAGIASEVGVFLVSTAATLAAALDRSSTWRESSVKAATIERELRSVCEKANLYCVASGVSAVKIQVLQHRLTDALANISTL
jgi:hypothetical protein